MGESYPKPANPPDRFSSTDSLPQPLYFSPVKLQDGLLSFRVYNTAIKRTPPFERFDPIANCYIKLRNPIPTSVDNIPIQSWFCFFFSTTSPSALLAVPPSTFASRSVIQCFHRVTFLCVPFLYIRVYRIVFTDWVYSVGNWPTKHGTKKLISFFKIDPLHKRRMLLVGKYSLLTSRRGVGSVRMMVTGRRSCWRFLEPSFIIRKRS